jgi:hypothetical protein
MKNKNLIYIALGALAVWYFMKKSKKTTLPGAAIPTGTNLATAANELAAQEVKNINFVPDMQNDADQYKIDQKNCK